MFELLLPAYALNLNYAKLLVADLADEQMCVQPVPGRTLNHPAFILGHLTWASDAALRYFGEKPATDAAWRELFGMGSKVLDDRSAYPAKDALLTALEQAHGRLAGAIGNATPEVLSQPAPERVRSRFATVGNMIVGLMTSHEATHLGQLSAWRRALGLPGVF